MFLLAINMRVCLQYTCRSGSGRGGTTTPSSINAGAAFPSHTHLEIQHTLWAAMRGQGIFFHRASSWFPYREPRSAGKGGVDGGDASLTQGRRGNGWLTATFPLTPLPPPRQFLSLRCLPPRLAPISRFPTQGPPPPPFLARDGQRAPAETGRMGRPQLGKQAGPGLGEPALGKPVCKKKNKKIWNKGLAEGRGRGWEQGSSYPVDTAAVARWIAGGEGGGEREEEAGATPYSRQPAGWLRPHRPPSAPPGSCRAPPALSRAPAKRRSWRCSPPAPELPAGGPLPLSRPPPFPGEIGKVLARRGELCGACMPGTPPVSPPRAPARPSAAAGGMRTSLSPLRNASVHYSLPLLGAVFSMLHLAWQNPSPPARCWGSTICSPFLEDHYHHHQKTHPNSSKFYSSPQFLLLFGFPSLSTSSSPPPPHFFGSWASLSPPHTQRHARCEWFVILAAVPHRTADGFQSPTTMQSPALAWSRRSWTICLESGCILLTAASLPAILPGK